MKKEQKLSCYEPLPREPPQSFDTFRQMRDRKPHERNLRLFAVDNLKAKGITESHPDFNKRVKRERNRLRGLSCKWKWQERCKLYDLDKQRELIQKRDDTFYNMNETLLDVVEGIVKYSDQLLEELFNGNATKKDGDEYSLGTKIKMFRDLTVIIKDSNELLCNLCGRPSEYSKMEFDALIDVDATVKDDESEAEKLERAKTYFKEIETEMKTEQS